MPQDSVADAVAFFNSGQADAVSGWEPDIYDAEESSGVPLLSSNQLRIVMDVIVTSRQSIADQAVVEVARVAPHEAERAQDHGDQGP